MLVYDDIKSIIYIKKMDRLPKLAKVGYCCFLFFILALASILGYIIANQGIDITHKIDEANCIQQTSISVISCSQICRNKYSYFSIEQSDSCCTLDSSCMLKTICKDDLVSSERMEINSMLTNLYFECGFLGFIAFIILVFMCYKFAKRKQQQSRLLAQNDNIQERIQSILDRINNCQEPLIAGTKQQLNPSQFADNVNDVCPICLEEFQERKVIKMDCAHVFHSRCIEQWITVNARCPVCRTRL